MSTTTEIEKPQNFQEKMFERIKESMGDLITQDEMKSLVDKAMQEAFFTGRKANDRYDSPLLPSLFVELIQKEMKAQVTAAINTWVKENPEAVTKALDEAMAKGFYNLVRQHQDSLISTPLFAFEQAIRQAGVRL